MFSRLHFWFVFVFLLLSSQKNGVDTSGAVQSEFGSFQYIGVTEESPALPPTNDKLVSGNPINSQNNQQPSSCHGCRSLTEIMDPTCFDITLTDLDSKPAWNITFQVKQHTILNRVVPDSCLDSHECTVCLNATELYDMMNAIPEIQPFASTVFPPNGAKPQPGDPAPPPSVYSMCLVMSSRFGMREARSAILKPRIMCFPGCIYGQEAPLGDMLLKPEVGCKLFDE
ncbi:uncharacterized protein Gasu_64430 [Galdieria sulphuraria]|uniref:Uncharacterized protein n=1 Tax=Galdieria sulphuraria TaxID=130081 RepID=M2WQ55_GALSU|nr:uncharacterized protein Gasu_64430 [Galdieria sulphuraria]EME25900.1 hypothetical protein Gasu_64430 [Galdieria sulphuraria]|eukprot:XP_005702420.1 hypothetical protein Gasu_64430 [Galdieria sulphuraria]